MMRVVQSLLIDALRRLLKSTLFSSVAGATKPRADAILGKRSPHRWLRSWLCSWLCSLLRTGCCKAAPGKPPGPNLFQGDGERFVSLALASFYAAPQTAERSRGKLQSELCAAFRPANLPGRAELAL